MRDQSSARNDRRLSPQDLPWCGVLLALLFITYLPCLVFRYGYADDYAFLYWAKEDFWQNVHSFIPDGRPIYGYLLTLLFSHAGSISGLGVLRGVGLLGVECLAIFLFWFSRRSGWPRHGAFIVAAGVLTLPAWVVYVSWGACCLWGYIWIMPGAAFALLDDSWSLGSPSSRIVRAITSFCLIVIALATYQPAACAVWLFFVIYLLGDKRSLRTEVEIFLRLGAIFLLASSVYFLIFKLEGVAGQRAALDPNLWNKLVWFFGEVLPRGFTFGWLDMHQATCRRIALATLGLLLLLLFSRRPLRAVATVFFLVTSLVLGFTASIVTNNRWPTFRSTVVVYAIIFMVVAFVIVQLPAYFDAKRQGGTIFQIVVAGLVAVTMAVFANFNASHYFIYPQTVELAMVTSQVRKSDFNNVRRITVVPSTLEDSLTGKVYFDEFGNPSTSKWWVWQPILRLMMEAVFPESYARLKQIPVATDPATNPVEDPATRVFDFQELRMLK
jgi:hypothetical protein